MKTKLHRFAGATALCLAMGLLAGCCSRSISNSGYHSSRYGQSGLYQGELNEFDVLGIQRDQPITDQQIASALDSAQRVRLRKGSTVLLVQSGAMIPDEPLLAELTKSFSVTPFSGVPAKTTGGSYDKALRLAAAKGGCEAIVCYWGVLETAQAMATGRVVSWVPIVGGIFPDKSQHMRIQLKIVLVDVRSGNWSLFMPAPYEDHTISAKYDREWSDQSQVQKLKLRAYTAAAADILKIYTL
jgi:hypothetical protein